MAKRKSLNKRLSRYSRGSTGSAFLDPDTENLGDEQLYWWKNLENNTVMRPSMTSNTLNQTSPLLDPNSQIDSGKLQDGWWKVLETTDIADDPKLPMPTRKPDADDNTVSSSETDEEPNIRKRKVTLRSAARKSRGNPFMNIVESETSGQKGTEESPMNKSGSINKGASTSERVNKTPESSSDTTDVVLKVKPTLFKRKHKDLQRNVFDDVLKENELLTPKKRKSLKLSSLSKTGTLMQNKITESPIVKQGGSRSSQLVLSFENDDDLSRLPNPEAQSTLLESSSSMHGSNKDSNNSEAEARVLKPKSRFLIRHKRGADKNVFADIIAEGKTHNDVEISKWKEKSTDANAEASKNSSVGQAGGSFRGPQSTLSNVVNEIRTSDAKATKGSRSIETITSLAQDPSGSVEPNASAQTSIASSDTSDKSQDHNIFLKPRSTFLKKSRKRSEINIFQKILEEDDDVDALKRSRSDALIDRTKEDLMMKNQDTVARETRSRGVIGQESNIDSEEVHLRLSGSMDEDNAWPGGNNAKETSELYRSTYDSDIEFSELGSEPKEERQRRSALHVPPEIPEMTNRRTASLPRVIDEVSKSGASGIWNVTQREAVSDVDLSVTSQHEEGNRTNSPSRNQRDILEENKGSSHKQYMQFSIDTSDYNDQESEVTERTRRKGASKLGKRSFRSKIDDSESDDLQSTPSRPSKKLRTSIRQSTVVTPRDTDPEPVINTPKRQSKSLSKSRKLLSTRVMSESETEDVQETTKKQSRRLKKSQKLLSSRDISEDEAEEVQATSKRQSRSLSKSQTLLSSRDISEDEAEEVQATSERQSRSLSKSQKLLSSRDISEDEAEEVQATSKRQSRSLSKSQKLLSSRVISEAEVEDVQATPKRQSRSSSRSQKWLSTRVMSESETEDVQETTKGQTRSLSKSRKLLRSRVISENEAEEVQASPKRQSKSLSKSRKLLSSRVISEDEAEEVQATSKNQNQSLSKSQKLLSSRDISEDEAEEVQATSKNQNQSLSKSQKLLSSRDISEDEAEEVQATSKRQSRSLSKSQKLLSSRVISEAEVENVQATPKRQSRSSSRSQKWLSTRVMSESETEDVQETTKGQTRSLSKSRKLLRSRVISENEAEEVQASPKRQSKSLSKSRKLLSSRVISEDEAEEVQATSKNQNQSLSKSQKLLSSRDISEDEAEEVQATSKNQNQSLSKSQKLLSSRDISEDEAEEVQATSKRQSRSLSKSQKLLSSRVISEAEVENVQATPKRQSRSSSRSQKWLSTRVMSESETEDVQETTKRQTRSLSKSQKLLSSRVISENEAEEVQATRRQTRSVSKSQKWLRSRVMSDSQTEDVQETTKRQTRSLSKSQKLLTSRDNSEDEAEGIQSTRKTRESKSVDKAQKRSSSNAIEESEAEHPNTLERRSKVSSKLPNEISSAANQIEPPEVDGGAKRQSKSISRMERQSTVRIVSVSETKEIESSRQKHSRNFMSPEPSVSPARGDSQLTVPITGESNKHRVQEEEDEDEDEEEEEGGGIDAGVKSFSATRRSEQRDAFNPDVTKGREDEDLLNASSKNAKEAKKVSGNDPRRNFEENRSVASGKAKGSVGATRMSTNRGKDSSRGQRNIEDFLNVRKLVPASQVLNDNHKAEEFKRKLEEVKKRIMDDMMPSGNSHEGKLPLQQKKPSNLIKTAKATQKKRPAKSIDKAFMVNGQVYKPPRLPRPKHWVTDRLYKYLWKQLEPKYTLQTRVTSEKFVCQLSNVMSFIVKEKSYSSYKAQLYALMKEMARLVLRSGIWSRDADQCASIRASHERREFASLENQSRAAYNLIASQGKAPRASYIHRRGRAACRHVEEIAQQVRTQTPQGHQETVDEEPQGEKVGKLDLLALGHTGPRGNLFVVVPAVSGHQKHRHVHDVRGRELGGLRLDVLLLRRVRGESEEREYRERDDHLTLADPPSLWVYP